MITRHSLGNCYPIKKLGDIGEFLDHKRKPVKESERVHGPYPYYGANGKQGYINSFIFDEPLILLAEDGGHFENPSRGIAYRIKGKSWVNNHAHVIRPLQGVDGGYLCRVLENYDVTPWVTGTTRGKLTKAGAAEIEIPLPPLPEQRRIAAILDKADALRAKRREAIAKLDQLLQSVFLEMFGDPVTNPKGWPVVSIQDACEAIVDCVNRTAPTVDYATDFKMIRTTNVRNFKVSLDSVRYVEKAVFDDWNRRLLPQKGDVILTREAPAGEAGILDSDDQVFLGQRLMLYRVNKQRATPHYLLYSFMGEGMQQQFKRQSSGSTVKHLSVPDCRAWDLALPPIGMQMAFSKVVEKNWSLHQSAMANADKLDTLFLSLQKNAFSTEQ